MGQYSVAFGLRWGSGKKPSGKAWPVGGLLACCLCLEGTRRMRWDRRLACAPEGSDAHLCGPRVMLVLIRPGPDT